MLSCMAVSDPFIIVGTIDSGVYLSSDYGATWEQKNEGLGGLVIYGLTIADGYVYASTQFHSCWKRPLPDLISVKKTGYPVPKQFSLYQNYPNPFNPVTEIKYDLPSAGIVKISVYDILGREIAVLKNEKQTAGTYNIEWNASNFASGVYIYKIETDGFVHSRKMILLK